MSNSQRAGTLAARGLIGLLALLAVFHVLVMTGVVPGDIVWGGRADSDRLNLVLMELSALLVTLLFIGIVAARTGFILRGKLRKTVCVAAWVMFAYFLLNFVGNMTAGPGVEMYAFGPLTLVLAGLSFVVARSKL